MQHKIVIALQMVGFLVSVVLTASSAGPQGNAPPSLQEQLEAQYQLTKKDGNTVVPGTVLVILKEGIIGVPASNPRSPVARYQDGALHAPPAATLAQFGKDARPLSKGDKVFVHKIDVDLNEDWVRVHIVECGDCTGAAPAGSFKSAVGFQFAKGYLKSANVPDVEDAIAQLFDIYTPPATPVAPPPEAQGLPPVTAGQGLTNDDVIRLVQVKVPDSAIITKIKSSACAFDTSTDGLVRLKQAGVSDTVLQAIVEAGGQAPEPPPEVQPAPQAGATCGDYASCITSGTAAYASQQWDQALASLQKASALDPTKAVAWAQMGRVYLSTGQYQDAVAMWDKTLQLGGTLNFDVWHYKPTQYERGSFLLSAKEVTFTVHGQEKVFSVAPAEVSSVKSHHPPLARDAWSFGMKAGGHNYWFSGVPFGAQCENPVKCSDATGYNQEEAVSNYIAQTIVKLAPGSAEK